ncbi:MAG: hypothetical protein KAX15_01380 [Candidatus Omnitrophica bacterium]|nr:hypothetical protein [Candidatus Omnitrophota bacterium]
MIPKFNINGYLPRGTHKATLSEIKRRFGSDSAKRKELFKGLSSLFQLLCKHKRDIKSFLLNGSFVTNKEAPEDFDCILILKTSFDFNSAEAKQLLSAKKIFNAHLFTYMEKDVTLQRRLIDFFCHDDQGKSKGILEVLL